MAIKAKNDILIEELIEDVRYTILETGIILKEGVEVGFTRNSEADKRGKRYKYIRYRGYDLKIHRVVYAKFNGKLEKHKVVHHKDDDSMNNHKDNLELVTQWQNMVYKKSNTNCTTDIYGEPAISEEEVPF